MASFVSPWTKLLPPSEPTNPFVPTLEVVLGPGNRSPVRIRFIVDSGADVSLAPRVLGERLGLEWGKGAPITLQGISLKAECAVEARVHDVELLVPNIGLAVSVPISFADGDASLLLGREGFFDHFRITFDQTQLLTTFELV
jgi:hypothetical protein